MRNKYLFFIISALLTLGTVVLAGPTEGEGDNCYDEPASPHSPSYSVEGAEGSGEGCQGDYTPPPSSPAVSDSEVDSDSEGDDVFIPGLVLYDMTDEGDLIPVGFVPSEQEPSDFEARYDLFYVAFVLDEISRSALSEEQVGEL